MKLVLLPGMDGTGILFERLLTELSGSDALCLSLPQSGLQDYQSLSKYVENILPEEDYVLVAESFSGGIAAVLFNEDRPHLRGIIFVASFLSSPNKYLAYVASYLPIKLFLRVPFSRFFLRFLFLGAGCGPEKVEEFKRVVGSVPSSTLNERLRTIARCRYSGFKSRVPAMYVRASEDRLVSYRKIADFKSAFQNLSIAELRGPHFILQAQAKESAALITTAVPNFHKLKP